jgi:cyclase
MLTGLLFILFSFLDDYSSGYSTIRTDLDWTMSKEKRMFLGAGPNIFQKAELLRASETRPERMLWSYLSNKKLGVKFRRQHPILNYVVDFYCHSHKLAIELDGDVHDSKEAQAYDQLRTEELEQNGLRVIRFKNHEVRNRIEDVLKAIELSLI